MAHFAKINEDKLVLQVLTLDNPNMLNDNGIEDEAIGQQYLEQNNNWPAKFWIQTSYNTIQNTHILGGTPFRGNYASIGYIWDDINEIFWPEKPFNSWIKNIETASWKSPIGDAPDLTSEQTLQNESLSHKWIYLWNEEAQSWNLTNLKA